MLFSNCSCELLSDKLHKYAERRPSYKCCVVKSKKKASSVNEVLAGKGVWIVQIHWDIVIPIPVWITDQHD